jgi:hypothetical protein
VTRPEAARYGSGAEAGAWILHRKLKNSAACAHDLNEQAGSTGRGADRIGESVLEEAPNSHLWRVGEDARAAAQGDARVLAWCRLKRRTDLLL